jgi:hypothetical protein
MPAPSLATLLDQQRDVLDRLCAEAVDGPRSAAHYDAMESTAQALALDLVSIFRKHRPNGHA